MLHEECAVFLPFHVTVSKFAKMLVNLQLVLNSVLDSSGLSSDIVIFSGITAADAKAGVLLSMPRRPCEVLLERLMCCSTPRTKPGWTSEWGKAATGGEANSWRRGQEPGSEPATNIENKY